MAQVDFGKLVSDLIGYPLAFEVYTTKDSVRYLIQTYSKVVTVTRLWKI
jgi:hypothetical protein